MKKYIITLLKFILYALPAYVVIIILWGEIMPYIFLKKNLIYPIGSGGHMYTRMHEVKKTRNADIIFLGSSHCYRSFDTRIFKESGYQSFNLGSSSQTPLQSKLLLNRYLDKLNPKLVILETSPESFASDGVESSLDIIANDELHCDIFKLALKQNDLRIYNSLIFSSYCKVFNRFSDFAEDQVKSEDTYITGGFVEKKLSYFRNKKYDQVSWKVKESQLNAFKDIVQEIEKKGIRTILVQAPVASSYYHSIQNINEFDSLMAAIGEYYNFNEFLILNDSLHFFDKEHLNQEGVKIFNEVLIKKMLKEE